MKRVIQKLKHLMFNISRVMRLGYEIDSKLLVRYYVTAGIGAVAPVVAAYWLRVVVDSLISGKAVGAEHIIFAALAGYYLTVLVQTVVYGGLNVTYYDYLLRNKLQAGLNWRYSRRLSSMDLGHLENSEIQNLITKVRDTFTWQIPDFLRVWNYIFTNLVGVITATIVLSPFGIWIPGLIILIALPRVYLKIKHGNFVWAMYGGSAPEAKKLWYIGDLLTSKDSIIETRIFQSQQALLGKLKQVQDHLFNVNKKPLDNYRWVVIVAPIVEGLIVFGIVYALVPKVVMGVMSVGSLAFIISTLEQLRSNAAWGAAHFGELYEKSLFVDPYFELMGLPRLVKEKESPIKFDEIRPPRIEFKKVSFTYPNGHEVLKDVSFVIKPGESVAFVGVNGAGKSTIIKLLCRFYDVSEGQILVNGVDIRELSLENWYKHLGTLFQEFVRYNFTVKENIMLGAPGIDDEERMKSAARLAGASEFVEKFEKGYEQMLGRWFEDRGEELSGGQWQKMAIARAFYEQAPVLVMDEPTSAIDAESEYEIFQNLEKVYKNRTLILVSHRFSTVRNASKIIVIDDGQVIESGGHDELLKKRGKYAAMFLTQAKGYQ